MSCTQARAHAHTSERSLAHSPTDTTFRAVSVGLLAHSIFILLTCLFFYFPVPQSSTRLLQPACAFCWKSDRCASRCCCEDGDRRENRRGDILRTPTGAAPYSAGLTPAVDKCVRPCAPRSTRPTLGSGTASAVTIEPPKQLVNSIESALLKLFPIDRRAAMGASALSPRLL